MRCLLAIAVCGACGTTTHGPAVFPPLVTVTEGDATELLVSFRGGPYEGVRGGFRVDGVQCPTYPVTMTPCTFSLDGSTPYPVRVDVQAAIDDNTTNEHVGVYVHTSDSEFDAGISIRVVDVDAMNVIASNWRVMLDASGATTFTVHTTQPPSADVVVEVKASGDLEVTPASLAFAPSTFDVAQTVTVHGDPRLHYNAIQLLPNDARIPAAQVGIEGPFDD